MKTKSTESPEVIEARQRVDYFSYRIEETRKLLGELGDAYREAQKKLRIALWKEFNPVAQAGELILAYRKAADEVPHPAGLAAALRDAADQVVPEGGVFLMTATAARIRRDLLAIAAELER